MALFGRILEYVASVNANSFVVWIEVRSRKNGKARFIIYKGCIPAIERENDESIEGYRGEHIFTECANIDDAIVVWGEYRRGVISCFNPAPWGFYLFVDQTRILRGKNPDLIFRFFPRWVQCGKRVGRRREDKKPKVLKLKFGDPHCILSVKQRELSRKQNHYRKYFGRLSQSEADLLASEIAVLKQDVRIARQVLRAHIKRGQD